MKWKMLARATTALTMATILAPPAFALSEGVRRATAQARYSALRKAGVPPAEMALAQLPGRPKDWAVVLHLNGVSRLLFHDGDRALVQLVPAPPALALRPRRRARPALDLPVLDGLPILSSPYGLRLHPLTGGLDFHRGIDLVAPEGTLVRAAGWGVVRAAGFAGAYGNMVEVEHPDGLVTRYGHLASMAVRLGQVVGNRAVLGRVGATGRATAPHLHFETRFGDRPVDPRAVMAWARPTPKATLRVAARRP